MEISNIFKRKYLSCLDCSGNYLMMDLWISCNIYVETVKG